MKRVICLLLAVLFAFTLAACDSSNYAESDHIIISPKSLSDYIGKDGVVIVDMQDEADYLTGHVEGAVNIEVSNILVSLPVDNMLASKGKVATVLGEAGIDNNTQVVIYDGGNAMNAARLWWTLLCYGHENVKVVDGGIGHIADAGINLTTEVPQITEKTFEAVDCTADYVVDMKFVQDWVDDPDDNVVLIDNRTNEEYAAEGKIPGSVLYSHTKNFYTDGTYLNTQAIRINYIEQGARAENELIVYCRTSMRSATTFLALYNAGYRNIKMYDGAWLEWSSVPQNPIDMPAGAVASSGRDNS